MSPFPPEFDAKWRFFWNIGERPADKESAFPKVVPEDFPEWENKMDLWGNRLLDSGFLTSEMAAIGMGMPADTFTSKMEKGPHLLAPTGSDLEKWDVGTPFAGFHYDLNFLTCHGKSRYPGLYVWLRDMRKVAVKVPAGCFLQQAGSMFEHITGGYVLAGYHEVIYTEGTKAALRKAKEDAMATGKDRIYWRVSSTLFSHLRHDVDISPLPALEGRIDLEQAKKKYKQMTADEKLHEELAAIALMEDARKAIAEDDDE
jgi:isopenicillin N synthase-like dioxygenase